MYPPKKTDNVEEWLSGLLESLGRGGLEFSSDIGLDEVSEGFGVIVRLTTAIPTTGWEALKVYITTYSIQSGWLVEDLHHTKARLTFTASKA